MKCAYPPRPYQVATVEKWFEFVRAGGRRGLVCYPTGCGKTLVAAMVAARSGRTLFITHRDELISQTVKTAKGYVDGIDVGVVKADRNEVGARDLVVASVATISRPNRLDQLLATGDFDLVVVDECFPGWVRVDGRPISEIKVGDVVWSRNTETDRLEKKRVVRLFKRKAQHLVTVHHSAGSLTCTANHPILTCDGLYWPAGLLCRNELIRVTGGGHDDTALGSSAVDRVERVEREPDGSFGAACPDGFVYNLEVEDNHSYVADGVVVHNCHHAAADSYLRVIDDPRLADKPCMGLTATPERNDEKGLAKVWGPKPIYLMTRREAEAGGWVVPFVYDRVVCDNLNLSAVRKNKDGDWELSDLDKEMLRADVSRAVAGKVAEVVEAQKRKMVVFTVSIDQSQRVNRWLCELGVASMHLSGDTPVEERQRILDMHRSGRISVVTNALVLVEGYDDPSITGICMARPTLSRPFYIQAVGRAGRPHPMKTDFLILDVVGAHDEHGITAADILDEDDGDGTEVKRKKRDGLALNLGAERDGEFAMVVSMAKATTDGIDDRRGRKKKARTKWLEIIDGRVYAMPAGEYGALILSCEGEGAWRGYRLPKDAWGADEARAIMSRPAPMELAQGVVEDRARKLGVFGLSNEAARWRRGAVTTDQLGVLKSMSLGGAAPASRGEASDAITVAKLRKIFAQPGTLFAG